MTNNQKIEILKKVMEKAKTDLHSLTQKELGIVVALSYGATLDHFSEKELEEVK